MPEDYSIAIEEVAALSNDDHEYYPCWSSTIANRITYSIGQINQRNDYWIRRGYFKIPLSDIPAGRVALSANLVIYISSVYLESRYLSSYELVVVEYEENEADVYGTFGNFGSGDMGSLTITSGIDNETKDIELNSLGIEKLNAALVAGDEYVYFGLRTSRDIDAREPELKTGETRARELVYLNEFDQFLLEVTTANWPEDRYPDVPVFPDVGFMDVGTYVCIKAYIEDLTQYVSEVVTGSDIVLSEDAIIELVQATPLFTPGEVAKNDLAYGVKFSTLSSDSTITTCGSIDIEALTNTTLTLSGNASITYDLDINSTGYASIKEQIEHDNLWWEAMGDTPSVAATKAKIYQELSTGDLKITINSGGQTKTAILADFSAL